MPPEPGATTHEREFTEPVDIAMPDGRRLNPEAVGWSRRPLQRANLRGGWGRTKRWDYWLILAGDIAVACTYADVDYLGLVDVWWADLPSGRTGGRSIVSPFALGVALPDTPGGHPLHVRRRHFELEVADDPDGTTHLHARWRERGGAPGRLRAEVALPVGHESLNVVVPWSDRRFQYTSKHQARPACGELVVGDFGVTFGDGGTAGAEAWGVLDVGRGRWPYRTRWNWGGGAGRARSGHVVGLQLGGRWTEGTGVTENGVVVDGVLTKIGAELHWTYDWRNPLQPWRVTAPDGSLELELAPRYDRHSRFEAGVAGSETHQVFGTWSGTFVTDGGEVLELDRLQGFAEESRSRW